MDEISTTTAANRGSTIQIQQSNFTTAYRGIKAAIIEVCTWLSWMGFSL